VSCHGEQRVFKSWFEVRREGWWLKIAVLGKVCFHVSGKKFALAERKQRGGFDLSICFHRIEILNQTFYQTFHQA
jgi:hypothetical protein